MNEDKPKPRAIERDPKLAAKLVNEIYQATNHPGDHLAIAAYLYGNVLGAADAGGATEQEIRTFKIIFEDLLTRERTLTVSAAPQEAKDQWKAELEDSRKRIN